MNSGRDSRLPTLYELVPSQLGGCNSKPVAAALNNILPYPPGVPVVPDDELNDVVRYKTLLLEPWSQSRISKAASKKTNIIDNSKRGESVLPTKKFAIRHSKLGRPNGSKLTLSKNEQKYSIYEPLRKLWLDYATKLYQNSRLSFADSVVRMDLHGAPVTVTRARDPSLVGLSGTLVAETANTIIVVTQKDRAITIPKNVSIVNIQFEDVTVEIFLPALTFRASERSARKIKKRHLSSI